jgi:hypothetical protein
MSAKKVEVQKGPIHPDSPPTLRRMTYPQRVQDRKEELASLRDGMTLKLHEPKSGRK